MKKSLKTFFSICIMLLFTVLSSNVVSANNISGDETQAGISFSQKSVETSSEPPVTKLPGETTPTVKKGGILPQTGELMQPIILVLIGWLFIILMVAIYISINKSNKRKEYK